MQVLVELVAESRSGLQNPGVALGTFDDNYFGAGHSVQARVTAAAQIANRLRSRQNRSETTAH